MKNIVVVMRYFFMCYCILLFASLAAGQESHFKFNYNIENGLPSNHIYGTVMDKLGYLWISSPAGVVRYNGYEFKLFNVSNGLPTDDIWDREEDGKGRMWLGCISDEMGYIYNNTYHSVIMKNYNHTIYPRNLQKCGDGIIFTSINYKSGYSFLLGISGENDTVYIFSLEDIYFSGNKKNEEKIISVPLITKNDDTLFMYNNCVYRLNISTSHITAKLISKFGKETRTELFKMSRGGAIVDHYFFLPPTDKGKVVYYDIYNGSVDSFYNYSIDTNINANIYENIYHKNYVSYTIGNRINRFFFNDKKSIGKKSIDVKKLTTLSIAPSNITGVFDNALWGNYTVTNTYGLFINPAVGNFFKTEVNSWPEKYSLIGLKDSAYVFLWNSNGTLAVKHDNLKFDYCSLKGISQVKDITYYKNDSFLLVADKAYWFVPKTKKIAPADNIDIGQDLKKAFFETNNRVIGIGSSELFSTKFSEKIAQRKIIDVDKYSNLIYDSFRHSFWAYNTHKIYRYNNGKNTVLNRANLSSIGIEKIDNIVIDNKYGNMFILQNGRSGHKLLQYDIESKTIKEITTGFNLKKSKLLVYNNTLILAGAYGAIFYRILGKGSIVQKTVYRNVKNYNYNEVGDILVGNNKILLNTDKGFFSAELPAENTAHVQSYNIDTNYRLVLYYTDTVFRITENDTLRVNPKKIVLQFDVINPYGLGKPHFSYRFANEKAWHELNSNELPLSPSLIPGRYYPLFIKASDDVWQGSEKMVSIFIRPYWWQVIYYHRLFWYGIGLLFLSLIGAIIFLTRRFVNKKNLQKNMMLEIEVKSVHSQINPHFIFNTLNVALLLIKRNKNIEAYDHVFKFSQLLRAFIASSRNRHITVADEIENLNNYVQLQQARFRNKFDYELILDSNIAPHKVKIPSLLMQPVVENAIDHGLFHIEEKGYLKIEFKKIPLSNGIQCIVDDNGIGRAESKVISANSLVKKESYGDVLIKDLVSIFNKYEHMGITIEYIDKTLPGRGTTVIISIMEPVYEK